MESFLFSLVNPSGATQTKLPLKGTANNYGIYCNSSYGPTFGGGHDLKIGTDGMRILIATASWTTPMNVHHLQQIQHFWLATRILLSMRWKCLSFKTRQLCSVKFRCARKLKEQNRYSSAIN